jgi:hypothetical protein
MRLVRDVELGEQRVPGGHSQLGHARHFAQHDCGASFAIATDPSRTPALS